MPVTRREFLTSNAATLLTAALPGSALAASPKAAPKGDVKTGGSRTISIDGGKYRIWVKKVGSGSLRVLTLHGGPGITHEYLECFEDFLPRAGITFWYYDQLGSGFSDQPDDTSLWTVERFREEVEQVRSALGLENFVLYGHSWGGMLAIEYALKYQKHLKALVISDMTASIASYIAYANQLRKALPPDILATLEKYEARGEYNAPEYEEAMFKGVYSRHICRLDPWPDPVERTFKHLNQKVYNTMQGPNEFVITGNFKDWDRWKDLPAIRVPTLLLGAEHDTMNPADIRRMGSLIKGSRVEICENGSHMAMYDDQERYFKGLLAFLRDVEKGRFVKMES
jgi:proline iminopeptidase